MRKRAVLHLPSPGATRTPPLQEHGAAAAYRGRAMYFLENLQLRAAARMAPPDPACTKIAVRNAASFAAGSA